MIFKMTEVYQINSYVTYVANFGVWILSCGNCNRSELGILLSKVEGMDNISHLLSYSNESLGREANGVGNMILQGWPHREQCNCN